MSLIKAKGLALSEDIPDRQVWVKVFGKDLPEALAQQDRHRAMCATNNLARGFLSPDLNVTLLI